jgi:hypothetical protein
MNPSPRAARTAGLLYLVTFAASIPAVALLGPVLDDPRFVFGSGPAPTVVAGALLDLVNAAACVGTAVVLYPLLRPLAPARALGFVTSRVLEASTIVTGVVALLAVVALRVQGVTDPAAGTVAAALVALRDWTFLLGPGLMPAINAVLLASVLSERRLVPRAIPVLGLIGAPLQFASVLATLFGLTSQVSVFAAIAVVPIFFWELSLGGWLAFRGVDAVNLERVQV